MYKIKLANGTIIKNVQINGNNYIPKKLNRDIFANNLDEITVTDSDGNAETLYNQKVQFANIGDVETFVLTEKTKEELENEQLKQENEMLSEAVTELTMLMSMTLEGAE